jgi:hypothetical protein
MKMKLRLAAALLLLAMGLPAQATTVEYRNEAELFDKADAVVAGHVWREFVTFEGGMTRSHYEIEVQEGFKGARPGQYIIVQTIGGELPNGGEYVSGSPHPKPGADVIMFLTGPHGKEYGVLSLALGHYELRYNAAMHRYFTHRDVGSLSLVKGGAAGTQVIVPEDQLASEVLAKLRALAAERAQ